MLNKVSWKVFSISPLPPPQNGAALSNNVDSSWVGEKKKKEKSHEFLWRLLICHVSKLSNKDKRQAPDNNAVSTPSPGGISFSPQLACGQIVSLVSGTMEMPETFGRMKFEGRWLQCRRKDRSHLQQFPHWNPLSSADSWSCKLIDPFLPLPLKVLTSLTPTTESMVCVAML